jgi:polyhydroxyalkanoate synthase
VSDGAPWAGAAPLAVWGVNVLDDLRRSTGLVLDVMGHLPRTSPSVVTAPAPGVRLHSYPGADPDGPPVLLIPAPIKRSYVFDLDPGSSVVNRCLRHGLAPYLVEWTDPGPDEQRLGLDAYASDLLERCLRTVVDRTGYRKVPLVGHSLGGTFAAICAARHPDLVAAVVLLEAPLHFGPDAGDLAALVTALDSGVVDAFPRGVPGSLLTLGAGLAAPAAFQLDRWTDLLQCLDDPCALATYLRVVRWTLDEFRQPQQLFTDVVDRLYRRDEFAAGTLTVAGRTVGPADLVAPVLTVVAPHSQVVPPSAVLPVHASFAAIEKQVLEYGGDTGVVVQHLGVLVGRNAHRILWPRILAWLDSATRATAVERRR